MKNEQTNNWHKAIKIWIMLSMVITLTLSAAPVKIMFLGDSITEGDAALPDTPEVNTSTYTGANVNSDDNGHIDFLDRIAYRGELWKLLKDANYTISKSDVDGVVEDENATFVFVGRKFKNTSSFQTLNPGFNEHHEGITGFTSKELLEGREGQGDSIDDMLNENTPDIVLLHIGTNDGGQLSIEGTDNNSTVFNVSAILTKIFTVNPEAKVFVARIIEARRAHGRAGGLNGGGWLTKDLNDKVAEMVATHENTDNIKMVNLETGAELNYDEGGVDMQPYHSENNAPDYHPNANGYKKMAEKWFADMIASKWLPDNGKPVITLIGANPQQLAVGAAYEELGATAEDSVDDNVAVEINATAVDMSTEGNYTVTYNATDADGNEAVEVTRTVSVSTAPDTEVPVIILTGTATVEVPFGATYADAGATASDNVDGDITANITTVNPVKTNTAGTYSVTYDVNDAAGNPAVQVIRSVTVLPNPADDVNSNGIPDNQEKEWFTYEKATQTALVGPATAISELKGAEGVTVSPVVDADSITLKHTKAYIKAKSTGDVTTGFKDTTADKSTLKTGTSYAAGTKSVITKIDDKIIIETTAKLAKDASITMGDK